MHYQKKWKSFIDQANQLKTRNLKVKDNQELISFLSGVNYYKFTAYLKFFDYPNPCDDYRYTEFSRVKDLYNFDKKLRNTLMHLLEKIEVSLKTQFAYTIGSTNNCFGHLDRNNYINKYINSSNKNLNDFIIQVKEAEKNSKEEFVQSFKNKYTNSPNLPVWMTVELLSFGPIATASCNLNASLRQKIVNYYGISFDEMQDWFKILNILRNKCAHSNRVWNEIYQLERYNKKTKKNGMDKYV